MSAEGLKFEIIAAARKSTFLYIRYNFALSIASRRFPSELEVSSGGLKLEIIAAVQNSIFLYVRYNFALLIASRRSPPSWRLALEV